MNLCKILSGAPALSGLKRASKATQGNAGQQSGGGQEKYAQIQNFHLANSSGLTVVTKAGSLPNSLYQAGKTGTWFQKCLL